LQRAKRIANLPPYLFAQIDKNIKELPSQDGARELIVLSKSDPDEPTPPYIVQKMIGAVLDPRNHHYPDFDGLAKFRQAIVKWYRQRFGVILDPETEVYPLNGSKQGIIHVAVAFVNPDEIILVPDPGFPSYRSAAYLAEAKPYAMPLVAQQGFLPDFSAIPQQILKKARLMFLNYPHNPTGTVVEPAFLQEVVAFARQHDLIVCYDNAYAETTYGDYRAPSFLQIDGAKELGVEFFTFSKAFNMAGWRLAFVVGNSEIIAGIKLLDTHINTGTFYPLQFAGATALLEESDHHIFAEMNKTYERRLNYLIQQFNELGWCLKKPHGAVYVWLPVPQGFSAVSFTEALLREAGVVVSPGTGFGEYGEGYVRICVTHPDEQIKKGMQRIKEFIIKHGLIPPG